MWYKHNDGIPQLTSTIVRRVATEYDQNRISSTDLMTIVTTT
jgi:hypothetical protein